MATFKDGNPVVIVTDRELEGGRVTGLDLPPRASVIGFARQSFQGQKGWVSASTLPPEGGDPTGYEVGFRLQGNPRTVLIREFVSVEGEGLRHSDRTQQVDRGRGYLWVKAEDVASDPTPEGTFDQFQQESYEAGEFDLSPTAVLSEADQYLDAREAALNPDRYLQRRREMLLELDEQWWQMKLEQDQAEWERFRQEGWPSVYAYIQAHIEREDAGRLDWTPILRAVEQAERGDRTAFDALLAEVYVQGSSILPLAAPEVPTTACFDCDAVLPVSETWLSKLDGRALCNSCFERAEAAGRARRSRRRAR